MIVFFFHVFYFLKTCVCNHLFKVDTAANALPCAWESGSEESLEIYEDVRGLQRRYSTGSSCDEQSTTRIKFSPPAYVQRYQAVLNVLTNRLYGGKLKKIVDFGCSELGFFNDLKNLDDVEELLLVDVDKSILEECKEKAQPSAVDYLHEKRNPLLVRILKGSVTEPDKLLENCDAVVCIELIEHLYPEPLTELPYNIFHFIRPKVAIITTPNADFNVVFKKMCKFRHPDHKFEWTRQQFQDWANNIVSRFPEYTVTISGICQGPASTREFGASTQMAVFHRARELDIARVPGVEGLYETIVEYAYPVKQNNCSKEEKIYLDAIYYIQKFAFNQENADVMPLKNLLNVMTDHHILLDDLRKVLEAYDYTVIDREDGPVVPIPPLSPFSNDSMDSSTCYHNYSLKDNQWSVSEVQMNPVQPNRRLNMFSDDDNWDSVLIVEDKYNETANIIYSSNVVNDNLSAYPNDSQLDEQPDSSVNNSVVFSFTKSAKIEGSNNTPDPCLEEDTSPPSIFNQLAYSTISYVDSGSDSSDIELLNVREDVTLPSESKSMCNVFVKSGTMSEKLYKDNLDSFFEPIVSSYVTNSLTNSNNNRPINNENGNTFNLKNNYMAEKVSDEVSIRNEEMSKEINEPFEQSTFNAEQESEILKVLSDRYGVEYE